MNQPDLDRLPVRVVEPTGHAPIRARSDLAIRVLEFDSPRRGESALSMHTGFSIISGLSRQGRAAVLATIDAVHAQTAAVGLGGTIVSDGTVHRMHATLPLPVEFDGVPTDTSLDIAFADLARLHALVDSIEAALRLSEAELRGADETRRALVRAEIDVPDVIDLRTTRADRAEIEETLAALEAIEPDDETIAAMESALERLDARSALSREQQLVDHLSAELDQLPTEADASERSALEVRLDDAVDARNRSDREHTSIAYELIDLLAGLGVGAELATAPDVARRVIAEQADLAHIRERLLEKLDKPAPRPQIHEPSTELAAVEARLVSIRRRQSTQRQLLRAANEIVAIAERAVPAPVDLGPMRDEHRPLPILLVEPLIDLPTPVGSDVLSLLLRVSEVHQVICISESEEVHAWADDVGGRVGHIVASGWFAGEPA